MDGLYGERTGHPHDAGLHFGLVDENLLVRVSGDACVHLIHLLPPRLAVGLQGVPERGRVVGVCVEGNLPMLPAVLGQIPAALVCVCDAVLSPALHALGVQLCQQPGAGVVVHFRERGVERVQLLVQYGFPPGKNGVQRDVLRYASQGYVGAVLYLKPDSPMLSESSSVL